MGTRRLAQTPCLCFEDVSIGLNGSARAGINMEYVLDCLKYYEATRSSVRINPRCSVAESCTGLCQGIVGAVSGDDKDEIRYGYMELHTLVTGLIQERMSLFCA